MCSVTNHTPRTNYKSFRFWLSAISGWNFRIQVLFQPRCVYGKCTVTFACDIRFCKEMGGCPGAVVKAACLESGRSRAWTPVWPLGFIETKCFFHAHSCISNVVGNLREREVACSVLNRQGSNFESCVWRAVSSHLSHHQQEVLLAQLSLYVHKCVLKPRSFYFCNQIFINYFHILYIIWLFTHLKLCLAIATHKFKLVNIAHNCFVFARTVINSYTSVCIFISQLEIARLY